MLDLKMRILVVDDFSTMRRIAKNILKPVTAEALREKIEKIFDGK